MNARYSREIDRLYLQMYAMLFEYARSMLANDALAEEAVQDTFTIACQKAEFLCTSPNPEGWLVNTMKNVLRNTIRSRNIAMCILTDYFASKANEIAVTDDRAGLEVMYDDIADTEEFKLVKEMALEGRSYAEMAQDRGISIATCRKRMERAKKFLREKIEI